VADNNKHGSLPGTSPEEVECVVYGIMFDGLVTQFVECWSGNYAECAMYIDSPQSEADIEMGTFLSVGIYRKDVSDALLTGAIHEQTHH